MLGTDVFREKIKMPAMIANERQVKERHAKERQTKEHA